MARFLKTLMLHALGSDIVRRRSFCFACLNRLTVAVFSIFFALGAQPASVYSRARLKGKIPDETNSPGRVLQGRAGEATSFGGRLLEVERIH